MGLQKRFSTHIQFANLMIHNFKLEKASDFTAKNMNFPFMCYPITGEAYVVTFFAIHLCTVHMCSEVANMYVLLEEMC